MKNWMISEHCPFFWLLRKPLIFIMNYFSQLLFHVTDNLTWLLKSTSFELFRNYFLLLTFALSFPYLTQSVIYYQWHCNTYCAVPVGCHALSVVLRCRKAEGILRVASILSISGLEKLCMC